jgi:DnaJ like chaperone protein
VVSDTKRGGTAGAATIGLWIVAAGATCIKVNGLGGMTWYGKAIGAFVGLLIAGPVGALFGAFLGHLFDAQVGPTTVSNEPRAAALSIQEAFFRATFQVMGHLAKADGRVTEEEIRAARAIMSELRLAEPEIQFAIGLFNEGKDAAFPLEATLRQLHQLCRTRPDLCRMFVQIQLQAALWGESLNTSGRKVLARICAALDISGYEVVQMEALLRMQQAGRQSQPRNAVDKVGQAHDVLGVARTASDGDVVKAYRRLMNRNHPDKLLAKGLPESMMKLAEEKTRQIRAAYELIREARGMK